MAKLLYLLFIVQVIQTYTSPAPSDVTKLEEIAKVAIDDAKLEVPITLLDASKTESNDETQGQRHKRFYNYYGYGFPPVSPVSYPNYPSDPNSFGPGDPFSQIYRRLQDIASVVRTQNFNQPPPPPQIPFLLPVLYIPQVGCACTPSPPRRPTPPRRNGTDDVGVSNRFPEMEDDNQNWGFVINQNETEPDDGQDEDFTRPISFVPIRPNRTMSRPPPPVEHGSSQGGGRQGTTTTMPPPPPASSPPSNAFLPAGASSAPSACDGAVLSCCHQPQVTYECFALQGCTDLNSYGNPCDSQVILSVIDRFQRFYGQRSG